MFDSEIHRLHRHGVLGLGARGFGDDVGFEAEADERFGERGELGAIDRVLKGEVANLPLRAVLDLGKVHMEVFHPRLAEFPEENADAVLIILHRFQAPLLAGVDVAEVDTGCKDGIDGAVTKEPTNTETGVKTYTCTACGEKKTETLPVVEGGEQSPSDPGTQEKPPVPATGDRSLVLVLLAGIAAAIPVILLAGKRKRSAKG